MMYEKDPMIALLQKYIQIDTSYPHANYTAAIQLLKSQAVSDGFLVRDIVLPSGNPVLVISLIGSSPELPSLVLNHHMDVVPAQAVDWKVPPFSGEVHAGILYGRGTQDCKGVGIAQYAAMRKFKQDNISPRRTIHCLVVPDEERGGYHGTKEFVEHSLYASLNIGYVIDEGVASGNIDTLLIKVDERTPIQILVKSIGKQGHAASIDHDNCLHSLIAFLGDIVHTHEQLIDENKNNKGRHASLHITSITTDNNALNVIPSHASATIDFRVPSSMHLDEAMHYFKKMIEPYKMLTYEVLATSKERYSATTSVEILYDALAKSIKTHNIQPKAFAFEATTDSRFYSHKGIPAVGFTPFTCAPNLHGVNESIECDDFVRGVQIMYSFLHLFCA